MRAQPSQRVILLSFLDQEVLLLLCSSGGEGRKRSVGRVSGTVSIEEQGVREV